MLKIWGRNNGLNVQKVMWCIGELDLPYERIDHGGPFGGNDAGWYRRMNPNGVVPTIDDDGFILWESNAIIRYLAATYGVNDMWPADAQARARADQWMDWQQTTLREPVMTLFYGLIRTPEAARDAFALDRAAVHVGELFQRLDRQLSATPFVAGDRFSIGDIPVGVLTYRWYRLDVARPDLPHLRAWYERLESRPAFRGHVMLPLT